MERGDGGMVMGRERDREREGGRGTEGHEKMGVVMGTGDGDDTGGRRMLKEGMRR